NSLPGIFIKGLTTGLILQIAVGPITFFIINIVIQRTLLDGFFAILGAALADYCYITLSIIGIAKLLENVRIKKTLGFISSLVLILFGFYIITGALRNIQVNVGITNNLQDLTQSFISTFMLTLSNPLTIIFWTSIFTARSIEYSLNRKELIVFGFAAGLAVFLFLGTIVLIISIFKYSIPVAAVRLANILVGLILITYGLFRSIKNI
ncbi:MAG: LysE family transporter, partial [Atribacterota bacterium]|nr:LysE family transporter [Atribacterota bacterium]